MPHYFQTTTTGSEHSIGQFVKEKSTKELRQHFEGVHNGISVQMLNSLDKTAPNLEIPRKMLFFVRMHMLVKSRCDINTVTNMTYLIKSHFFQYGDILPLTTVL